MIFKVRTFINPPYTVKEIFFTLGMSIILIALAVIAIQIRTSVVRESKAASVCDTSYPTDSFRACYFSGKGFADANYLGSFDESPISSPVPTRTFAINYDWGSSVVFAGRSDDISGVWRGSLNFEGGLYQISTIFDDNARVYIDDNLVIDQWVTTVNTTHAIVIDISAGYHNIRVEWYENTGSAKIQLHWDKGPDKGRYTPQNAVIDVFILTSQDFCIAGESWVSGDRFDMYNSDGSVSTSWKRDEALSLPKILKPSDPSLSNYSLVECFQMGFRPEELTYAKEQVKAFADDIKSLSNGAVVPIVEIHEIFGEQVLTRWGGSLWLGWWDLAEAAEPFLSRETDYTIALSSVHDLNTGAYHGIPLCGGTYGLDFGLGGAGFTWVPNSANPGPGFQCLTEGVILNEWAHQFTSGVNQLFKPENIYKDGFPQCGGGDPDTFKWMPGLYDIPQDPSSSWCGSAHPGSIIGVGELFSWHYDPTFAHYQLNYFTGNHCDNKIQDFGETGVDVGGNCPKDTILPTVNLTSPTNGATVSGTVNTQATATDNVGVTKVEFYVDGTLKGTDTTAPYSYNLDTNTISDGSHTLLAKAYDASNNISISAVVNITVDNIKPSVSITSPSSGKTVSGTITVAASASDTVGVTKVEFYLDSTKKYTDTTSPYTFKWDTTKSSNNKHSLLVKAYDATGKIGISPGVSLNVSNNKGGPARKLGDLNGDNLINIRDLSILVNKWSVRGSVADINSDGRVNIRDLSILLSRWGR